MQNYLDLHRHAVVRLAVVARPKDALRLLIAHAVASSGNWSVHRDPQMARSDNLKKSIAASPAQAAFAAEAKKVCALLAPAFKGTAAQAENGHNKGHVAGLVHNDPDVTARVFERLLKLKDADVARIAAFVMAETLSAGSAVTDAFGVHAKVETRKHWSPDTVFFDLVRDRQSANAMLAEAADKKTADKMVPAKLKEQKTALLAAAGKNAAWCPGWMRFPTA
jgi:ParB family chromosome partitioning protein